ncbi:hypothetical protein MRB53_019229 [Persea americana]|uniref:Uncharacterized protein n=1 Tax=Persea americana TaxID=3435 RepID=A0ACC2KYM2_PERAE|nr:hypothetical protein MRB53_019229 [Persea americana]
MGVNLVLFLLLLSGSGAVLGSKDECVYTMYVRTGSVIEGGTDTKIGASFGDGSGREVRVSDLEDWGLMGPYYDYYEIGNRDIFSARGPCLSGPLCSLNLTSDGSGDYHGWYCEYVEVTSTGPHKACTQTIFYVRQWLARDSPPYQLTALLDGCAQSSASSNLNNRRGPLIVGNPDHADEAAVTAAQ